MAAITPVLKAAKWCSFIPTNQSYIMYHETAWMHPSRQSLLHCRNNTLFQSFPIRLSKRKKQWRKDSTNRTCIWRWFPMKAYASINLGLLVFNQSLQHSMEEKATTTCAQHRSFHGLLVTFLHEWSSSMSSALQCPQ